MGVAQEEWGEHLCPLQGGPFIVGSVCRLGCPTGLVRGRRPACGLSGQEKLQPEPGSKDFILESAKGLVSIGSLAFSLCFFSEPSSIFFLLAV